MLCQYILVYFWCSSSSLDNKKATTSYISALTMKPFITVLKILWCMNASIMVVTHCITLFFSYFAQPFMDLRIVSVKNVNL